MPDIAAGIHPPQGSRLQIVESDEHRRVIYIPEGGPKTASLGKFLLAWFAVCAVATWLWWNGELEATHPVVAILVLGGFWFIGLGLTGLWLKLRFTTTILLLEPGRLVMQKVFLEFKSIVETPFLPDTKAILRKAYEENDDPVYSVAVVSGTRTAEFAAQLSLVEKEWLVEYINDYLNPSPVA